MSHRRQAPTSSTSRTPHAKHAIIITSKRRRVADKATAAYVRTLTSPQLALCELPVGSLRFVHPFAVDHGALDGHCHQVRRGSLERVDRKSTRLNSSHLVISYAVFCLKKKSHNSNFVSDKLVLTSVTSASSAPVL